MKQVSYSHFERYLYKTNYLFLKGGFFMNKKQQILSFIALSISCFLTVLDGTIVNVSLPSMANFFSTDLNGISWVTTIYLITFSSLLLNFAKIADIFGRKKLFIIGLFIFGISSALCGMAPSLNLLIIFRALQGVGAAILTPLSIPIGVNIFGKEKVGKLTMIIGMIISVAAAAGPVLGGLLNQWFGYKSIFYVNIPFILIAIIFGYKYIEESYDATLSKKIDFIGSLLIGYGLGSTTFILSKGNYYGWTSKSIILISISAFISILLFFIYEKKILNPMIDFYLFKKNTFTSSIFLIAMTTFSFIPITYLMNFYFVKQLNYNTMKAGLTIGIIPSVGFLSAPLFCFIANKISHRLVSGISMTLFLIADFTLSRLNSVNYIAITYTAFILAGLGIGGVTPLYQSTLFEIPEEKNGIASGILNTLRQLTMCLAIAISITLSTNYSTSAVSNTKSRTIAEITQNTILDDEFKSKLIEKIQVSDGKNNSSLSIDNIKTMLEAEGEKVLASVPPNMKLIVKNKLETNISEALNIFHKLNEIKNDEINNVYAKCYLVIGLISMIGLMAVPFNSLKNKETLKDKRDDLEAFS